MEDNNSNIGGFKKFIRPASRIVDKISVTTNGVLGFSASFSSEHRLGDYKSVSLYWNDSTKEVGLEFTTVESDILPKLRAYRNGSGYTANGKAFFAVNHIDTEKYHGRAPYRVVPFKEIDPSYTGNEQMYVIKIQELQSKKLQQAPVNQVEQPAIPASPAQPVQTPPETINNTPASPPIAGA